MTKLNDRSSTLFICHECDALQHVPYVEPGKAVSCSRCGFRLFRNPKGGIDKPLALAISSMILFLIANIYPIMTIKVLGIEASTTITESAIIFYQQGSPIMAAVVWLSSVFIPGFIIFGLCHVLISIRFQLNWRHTRRILVWLTRLLPWAMMDVFLLAILVALVKLVSLADIVLGAGFFSLLALIYFYAATIAAFDPHILWEQLDSIHSDQAGKV